MVVAETLGGLSALKTAMDMAKALKDINDATIRNSAVIELQEKILAAREAQTTLLERIGDLEKEVASFEKWNAEKENYQLASIHADTFAYVRKPSAEGNVPSHYICATCYEGRKKRILQRADAAHVMCPDCKSD
jgi:CII-binding regulator of phage lambda lysogenization HflD